MKKPPCFAFMITLMLAFCFVPIASLFSQAPQGLNYQAVARDNTGSVLENQHISVRFTLTDEQGGPVLYQEIQNSVSNEFGLITLHIGKGIPVAGVFSAIDWSTITPWLQVDMDMEGGTSYLTMGTSPLMSVPYAMFAANSGGESVWDTSGTDIYFNNHVGIGTEDPSSPLTIQTGINEIGFSHITGENPITLATSISDVAGSFGTMSEHPLSLLAGGEGKLHVLPDGRVILGNDADPINFSEGGQPRSMELIGKLNLETPINSTGWIHVGGADSIIVSEGIGGVSAALGTVTNHVFRLNSGGQGRLQVFPDGNVVVGTNAQAPYGKFTVHTPNNSDGIVHVSDGGIIMKSIVGGVSAGFGTFSSHMMRIFSNSVAVINIDPAGNIGIGTLDPLPGYRLSVNGNIKAKELVIETTGWPDYVFADTYTPRSLPELEKYIQQHQHLPNIPGASEIEKEGVAVGEMQKMMLEKIEELTLYLIQQQKTIAELQSTVAGLKK